MRDEKEIRVDGNVYRLKAGRPFRDDAGCERSHCCLGRCGRWCYVAGVLVRLTAVSESCAVRGGSGVVGAAGRS